MLTTLGDIILGTVTDFAKEIFSEKNRDLQ